MFGSSHTKKPFLMPTHSALFARQPIFDAKLKLHAYELLFRPTEDIFNNLVDGDSATSQVILNALTATDFGSVLDSKLGYINFTRNWLKQAPPLPVDQVVVEILEDIEVDEALIQDVQQLSKQGFTIALDDFVLTEKTKPLLNIAHIVKMDVLNTNEKCLIQTVKKLKEYPLKLLAEKVEDHAMYQKCKDLGFEYFQGFFLSKPENIQGKVLQSSQLTILNILVSLQNPDININDVEALVAQDPALSYKVLRIINSPLFRVQQEVTSIHKAINLLGLEQIKRWASIISLTKLTNKPDIIFLEALFRAKMCEEIAIKGKLAEPQMYFTVGLFSMLDAFFDKEIQDILKLLPLAEPVKAAIEFKKGLPGNILHMILMHQQGKWEKIPWEKMERKLGIDERAFESCQLAAINWSQEIFNLTKK